MEMQNKNQIQHHPASNKVAIPIIVALIMFGCTLAAWYYARSEIRTQQSLRFNAASDAITKQISQRVHVYENALNDTRAFFASSDEVTLSDWNSYIDALDIQRNYEGISGMSYLARVRNTEVGSYQSSMQQVYRGRAAYNVHPESSNEDRYLFQYVYPFDETRAKVLGFDAGTDPARSFSIEQAMDSGAAVTTGVVKSLTTGQQVFSIYIPLYQRGSAVDTVEQRRENLMGIISVGFRLNEVFKGMFNNQVDHQGIDFVIVDNQTTDHPTPEQILYSSSEENLHAIIEGQGRLHERVVLRVPGRTWQVHLLGDVNTISSFAENNMQWFILIFGSIFSVLLYWLLYSLFASRARAIKAAETMTQNLRMSEKKYRDIFESFQDVLYRTDVNGRIVMISPSIEKYIGLKPSQVLGSNANQFYDNAADREVMLAMLRKQGFVSDYPLTLKDKDGKIINVSLNAHMLTDENGDFTGIEGVLRDVSERNREAEEEKKRARELERLNKLMVDRELKMIELKNELKKYKQP